MPKRVVKDERTPPPIPTPDSWPSRSRSAMPGPLETRCGAFCSPPSKGRRLRPSGSSGRITSSAPFPAGRGCDGHHPEPQEVRLKTFTREPLRITMKKSGPGEVTAADIGANANIEILNPKCHIATLAHDGTFEMDIEIHTGRGFCPADWNKKPEQEMERHSDQFDLLLRFRG